jgi:hypothetical protein
VQVYLHTPCMYNDEMLRQLYICVRPEVLTALVIKSFCFLGYVTLQSDESRLLPASCWFLPCLTPQP